MELEVVWSGAMERAGIVPGLSSHLGRSSAAAAIEEETTREPGRRGPDKAQRKAPLRARSFDKAIAVQLMAGKSYSAIGRVLGVNMAVVRRVAKERNLQRGPWQPNQRVTTAIQDVAILQQLREGKLYRRIAATVGTTMNAVRRVATENGIRRRFLS